MKQQMLTLILCLGLLPLAAQLQIGRLQQQIQRELERIVEEEELPGATLAVVLPDGQLLSFAAGYADKENQEKMRPGARMFSGSVGKTFVAAVLLQLMEEKGIQLDTKVAPYFSNEEWFARIPNASDLTIRMLLQHTSGIPRYIFQESFMQEIKANPMKSRTPEELLSYVLDLEPIHPAGQGWGYSDTNFIILGMLIEKWSGDTYYHQLQKRIIDPFQLTNTFPSDHRELEGLTPGYIGDQDLFFLPEKTVADGKYAINPQFEWTGGGLVTNVEDLANFIQLVHTGKVIPEKYYSEMNKAVDYRSGAAAENGYGLANFIWPGSSGLHYGHAGVFPGHLSRVDFVKDFRFTIAFQYNTDQGMGRGMGGHLQTFSKLVIDGLEREQSETERDILENFKQQETCWNKGDIDCYMTAYHPSEEVKTISRAGVTYGYENIRRQYHQYWNPDNMGQLHFDRIRMHELRPDLYLVTGRFNLAGEKGSSSGHFSVIMQKIDGKWYMISDHSS